MRKPLIILASLIVLLIIFIGLNLTNRDNTRPQLEDILNTDNQIVSLSELAATRGSADSLKAAAATIGTLATSDAQQLGAYYKLHYRKTPKVSKDQTALEQLKIAEEGTTFDKQYLELMTQSLQANLTTMQTLFKQTKQTGLKNILDSAIANQTQALEQLRNLP